MSMSRIGIIVETDLVEDVASHGEREMMRHQHRETAIAMGTDMLIEVEGGEKRSVMTEESEGMTGTSEVIVVTDAGAEISALKLNLNGSKDQQMIRRGKLIPRRTLRNGDNLRGVGRTNL
jgi:hypothetical protein